MLDQKHNGIVDEFDRRNPDMSYETLGSNSHGKLSAELAKRPNDLRFDHTPE